MVIRLALAALLAAVPMAATGIEPTPLLPARGFGLPYDLTGFVVEPQRVVSVPAFAPVPVPQPEPAPPQVAARAPLDYRVNGALYDRTPDHLALSYDLTGFVPPRRREPAYGPLDYDLGGLIGASR